MQSNLTEDQLNSLRRNSIIESNEIAYRNGDLIVAENVITKQTRVIGPASTVIVESNKRILKG